MSGRISADLGRLNQLAAALDGLSNQVDALRANLTSAVSPALRGDVPEYWTISAQAAGASGALGDLSSGLRGRAGMIRRWTASMARVEQMLVLYRFQLRLQGRATLGWQAVPARPQSFDEWARSPQTAQLREDLIVLAMGQGMGRLPGIPRLADGTVDLKAGLGFLEAKGVAVGAAWNVFAAGYALEKIYGVDDDGNRYSRYDRIGGAVDLLAVSAGGGSSIASMLGWGRTATALGGATRFLGAAGLVHTAGSVGWTYGSHLRTGFELDDAAGRSSLDRINQQTAQRVQLGTRFGPTGTSVAAADAVVNYTTLGVYKGAQWAGRQVWPEAPPPDEIDPHKQAQLLDVFRQAHPGAQVVPLDGQFIVKLPSGDEVHSFFVDNTRLVIR